MITRSTIAVFKEDGMVSPYQSYASEGSKSSFICLNERFCLLRVVQSFTIVLLFYALSTYLLQIKIFEQLSNEDTFHVEAINTDKLLDPPWNKILDINNFRVLISPSTEICNKTNILFFIVVHSKPNHFEQRRIIRNSWGKLKEIQGHQKWHVKLIFSLGETSHRSHIFRNNVEKLVKTEEKLHSDIIQGSFIDKYRNLLYKHIFSIKWANRYCSNAKFIIKADDDAFIDLYGLHFYLERTLGPLSEKTPKGILAGNVFPAFTSPQRIGKWSVSRDEYPWDSYPSYLGGLAYVMTPDVASDLSKTAYAMRQKSLWVDDVFITGIVANSLNIHPIRLNARYIYDHQEVYRWFKSSSQNAPPPFTFAHLNTSLDNWKDLTQDLWNRISTIYKRKQLL